MSKVYKASKGSKVPKTLTQNIELQITHIDSDLDINSDNILHHGNDGGGEAKKQKKMSSGKKLSKLNLGGGEKEEEIEEIEEVGSVADEERRIFENMDLIASYRKNKNTWFDVKCPSMLPYIETPWSIIGAYFNKQHLKRLVRHQIESYNDFVSNQIQRTIEMFNPVVIASEQDFCKKSKKNSLEVHVTFDKFNLYRPQIHENNGATKIMFPHDARSRNFTYASTMTTDINIQYLIRTGENLENVQTFHKSIPKVHIGKLPIMLKSCICVLNQYTHINNN